MRRNGIRISSIMCGLLVMTAGALLFAFNSGFLPLEYKHIVFSWPMLLVAMGFVFLFSRHKWLGGILLMLVGGFFLLPKLNEDFAFVTQNGWAIGLVVGGILIVCKTIWGRRCSHWHGGKDYANFRQEMEQRREWHKARCKERHSRKWENRHDGPGYIDRNYVFGGAKEKIDFKDFKGGEINCVFGGVELDLSGSQLAEGVHHLEINSVFGGIILYIPIDWNVEIRPTQVFGNFTDNRPKPGFEVNENSTLIIEAGSVFGGGEIKCKEER